jgi:hypothetical protein
MRAEHQQAGQMELAGTDRLEQGRELANQAGGSDPPVGLVLGETQFVNTVEDHGTTHRNRSSRSCTMPGIRSTGGKSSFADGDEILGARGCVVNFLRRRRGT